MEWIFKNKKEFPVGDNRIEEAFSWRVLEKLSQNGLVGIIHHATSLFNLKSRSYREAFFGSNQVFRITNFTNFRQFIFKGISIPSVKGNVTTGAGAPAATFIYRPSANVNEKPIIHYGPFLEYQIQNVNHDLWSLTINSHEINYISSLEAAKAPFSNLENGSGEHLVHQQMINYLKRCYHLNLEQFCGLRN
ncbi:MAG: hypothetical protein R2880_02835 [Deinococcales bacterium]